MPAYHSPEGTSNPTIIRDQNLSLRLSRHELGVLNGLARVSGRTLSDYVRFMLFQSPGTEYLGSRVEDLEIRVSSLEGAAGL